MSVEELKKRRDIAWIDESYANRGYFGPPAYDETAWSYKWRMFRRGFTWGIINKKFIVYIGFILTTAVVA
jgi:hypothetical protein